MQHLCRHADSAVAQLAKKSFLNMVTCGRDLGYEVPGEARFVGRLQTAMFEALKASGRESVGIEEIDVDADWVD
jgi:hypothetical protein